MIKEPKVVIGVPSYDGKIDFRTANAIMQAGNTEHLIDFNATSLLAYTFNHLWCNALNAKQKGYTHFLMVHADIVPEVGFMDKMLAIMEKNNAHILSAIVPIKNATGLTSTAIDTDQWHPPRFTMKQLAQMPPTFTARKLLVNTGLMLVDIRDTWVYQIHFTINDKLERDNNGFYKPMSQPEDWNFSREARRLGANRIFATREVKLAHLGHLDYRNEGTWGWETDEKYGEAKLEG